MHKIQLILIFALSTLLIQSCVSTSKYQKSLDNNKQLQKELQAMEFMKEKNNTLSEKVLDLEEKLEQTEEVLFELNNKYNGLKQQHESLQDNYDDMLRRNQDLLEKAFADKTTLTEELIAKQAELNEKEIALNKLEKDLSNQLLKLEISQKNLAARQQRIDSLSFLLNQNESKLNAIHKKISDILEGYASEDIAVEKRGDGRLYISMSQNLLFKKGSDQLDAKGIAALRKLAKALNSDPSIEIMVEGHTDSDGTSKLNWHLSTDRAHAVVEVLVASSVRPERIIAAGRGQYQPVLPNTTEANKSKNRRTEIILSPDFEALQQLLQSE